ncbi:hypothetical protein PVK06_044623 [Gossypium arboreum]|uniref:Uncharacterized protein n=1 Tax=Gossypium arboreum TaxID=29729 RepID=A0ABR0MRS1_GOSAR|nr:hypothetical protein PVK06_044623 [Gossypium arboreum]
MFSWFYDVWKLENIFQRENVLLDTGKPFFLPFFNFKLSFSSILQLFPSRSSSSQILHAAISFPIFPSFSGSHSSSQGTDISRLISLVSRSKASLALEVSSSG